MLSRSLLLLCLLSSGLSAGPDTFVGRTRVVDEFLQNQRNPLPDWYETPSNDWWPIDQQEG